MLFGANFSANSACSLSRTRERVRVRVAAFPLSTESKGLRGVSFPSPPTPLPHAGEVRGAPCERNASMENLNV